MQYRSAVEVENLKENAQEILRSLGGFTPEDAMDALGAAVSHVAIKYCPPQFRESLLDALLWSAIVRGLPTNG